MEFETPVKGPKQVRKLLPRPVGARPGGLKSPTGDVATEAVGANDGTVKAVGANDGTEYGFLNDTGSMTPATVLGAGSSGSSARDELSIEEARWLHVSWKKQVAPLATPRFMRF